MKKFYSFLMAAALVGSASAANHVAAINADKEIKTAVTTAKTVKTEKTAAVKSVAKKLNGKAVKAIRKADGEKTIEGLWTFDMGDYYFKTSVNGTIQIEYEATVYGDEVVFEDPTGEEVPFIGVVDASGKSISFPREYLGTAIGYYVYQQPYEYNWNTDDLDDLDALVGEYYAEQGVILFDYDQGLAWEAYSDEAGTEMEGYFSIYDFEGATQGAGSDADPIDEVQEGLWKSLGNATFVDAWILPSYSMGGVQINPNDYAYEVELQQNVEDENIYRLWKPYTNGKSPLAEVNQSKFEGQIQFDLSDPDYVVVIANDMPAGFKNSNGEFYLSNELGWYINYLGGEEYKDLIISMIYSGDDDETEPDTFKDGVVTIHTPMFDFNAAHADGYTWNNNPYFSIITFPETGVDSIGADTAAKARYYNLQGVEVAAPADGIFIKVEGSKTTKVVK